MKQENRRNIDEELRNGWSTLLKRPTSYIDVDTVCSNLSKFVDVMDEISDY